MKTPDYLATHGDSILLSTSAAFRRQVEAPKGHDFDPEVTLIDAVEFNPDGIVSQDSLRLAREAQVATRVATNLASLRHQQNTGGFIARRTAGLEIGLARAFDPYARELYSVAKNIADSYSAS